MKAFILIIIVLFTAEILYVITKPPREITLKDISPSVYPNITTNEPATQENTLIDSSETDGDDNILVDYYIIVGSSSNPAQAQLKAEKLKNDFNTNFIVLPQTAEGYYRISCGKYSTMEEAKSKIISIKREIRPDVWILSVKR